MKNLNGSYGTIRLGNLVSNRFLIEDTKSDAEYLFPTVDALIQAGWAID